MHVPLALAKEFARNELPRKQARQVAAACDLCGQCAHTVALAVKLTKREAA